MRIATGFGLRASGFGSRREPRDAFTLIELLVATALTLAIVAIATAAFSQMLAMTRRLQARQATDATARTVYEKLSREVSAMHPGAAVWLRSDPLAQSVELVFMRGVEDPWSHTTNKFAGAAADLVWTRWKWSKTSGVIEVSFSRQVRRFQLDNTNAGSYWTRVLKPSLWVHRDNLEGPALSDFLSLPQARRETGTAAKPLSPEALLDENSWQTWDVNHNRQRDPGEEGTRDVGDYQDLLIRARPLVRRCTALTIEVLDGQGATHTADGTASLAWAAPGNLVDGRAASTDMAQRPTLIRLGLTLAGSTGSSSVADISFTYSFSCTTPHTIRY